MGEIQSGGEVVNTTKAKAFVDKLFSKPVFKVMIVGFVALVIVYYILGMFDTGIEGGISSSVATSTQSRYMTTLEYSKMLEDRLENLISSMSGVDSVSVMVSLDGTTSYEYMVANGKMVYDDSSHPVVLDEYLPNVSSVTIVVGGLTVDSKVSITRAVSKLFDLSTEDVYVLQG